MRIIKKLMEEAKLQCKRNGHSMGKFEIHKRSNRYIMFCHDCYKFCIVDSCIDDIDKKTGTALKQDCIWAKIHADWKPIFDNDPLYRVGSGG